MPLLKRKKVRQLPVPPVTLPPPTDVEAYLAADPVADAVTQEQQGGRREAFDGVVLPSPYPQHDVVVAAAADASTTTYKVWQPSREALRLLPPSTPHTSSNPDENGQENTDDDAQLRTLLLLKQKQADALASSSRNESPRDRDTGKVPLEVGKWREDEVWYIKQTGEIFHDYESYITRMSWYKQPHFTCEATGKTGLTFFAALESEREESVAIHKAFPPSLKGPVLRSVQYFVEGRLDDLVDRVFERFKDRFFPNEKIFVQLEHGEDKYFGNIKSVRRRLECKESNGVSAHSEPLHSLATSLWLSPEEVAEVDPANDYEYTVQLFGQEQMDDAEYFKASEDSAEHWGNVTVVVPASRIHRDRILFSKVSLKRLLRDALDRDASMYSPWHVKPAVARAYNVPIEMSAELKHRIVSGREGALQERKAMIRRAYATDETGGGGVPGLTEGEPPKKKHKKNPDKDVDDVEGSSRKKNAGDGKSVNKGGRPKGSKNKSGQDKQQAEEERLLAAEQEQRESEAAAEEDKKKRKKPYKFPAEDLLIELNEKDKVAGKPVYKPELNRRLPFPGNFEVFLMTWNFLNVFSKPLKLAQFSIDEFENALYHRDPYTPCVLLAETHAALLNLLRRDVVDDKQEETLPLKAFGLAAPVEGEEGSDAGAVSVDGSDEFQEEKLELITEAAGRYATSWMAKDLSSKDHRKGWEGALVGCLWMRSNIKTVPNLVNYLQALLIDDNRAVDSRPTWHTEETRLVKRIDYKYPLLHPVFKLEILAFLCELAMQTKRVRDFIDEAAVLLTKCRNDINDKKREIRKIIEERGAAEPRAPASEAPADNEVEGAIQGILSTAMTPDIPILESTADGDELDAMSTLTDPDMLSDIASDSDDSKPKHLTGVAARKKALIEKQTQREAEQKAKDEQHAQQAADAKAKREEHHEKRRLEDDLLVLEEDMAELDREFRRQHMAPRTVPIGTDRFGNRIWWFDGCGSADLMSKEGHIAYGTGRLYIQGAPQYELAARCSIFNIPDDEIVDRRALEEGTNNALLAEGEWAMIDESEQYRQFFAWLNVKGFREGKLLAYLTKFEYAILGGIQQREALFAVEAPEDEQAWAHRPKRGSKTKPLCRGKDAYLNYKNTFAK